MKKYSYRVELSTIFLYGQIGSGICVVLYLIMHSMFLFGLIGGEETFLAVRSFFDSNLWVIMEQLALVGILFHMLNGLRMIALMFGRWCDQDDDMQGVVLLGTLVLSAMHLFLPVIRKFL